MRGAHRQMVISWTTRDPGAPLVQWTADPTTLPFFPNSAAGASTTYKASDLCGGLDQKMGFFDPGTLQSATMTGLAPATRYYYRVGDGRAALPHALGEYNLTAHPPMQPVCAKIRHKRVLSDSGLHHAESASNNSLMCSKHAKASMQGSDSSLLWARAIARSSGPACPRQLN